MGVERGRGRKIEVSPCCFVANRTLLGPRGRYGAPLTNWWLLSPIRVQCQPPRLCLESQVRFCIMPRAMTGFLQSSSTIRSWQQGRGWEAQRGRRDFRKTGELMNRFTWVYAPTLKSLLKEKKNKKHLKFNKRNFKKPIELSRMHLMRGCGCCIMKQSLPKSIKVWVFRSHWRADVQGQTTDKHLNVYFGILESNVWAPL